VSSIEKSEFNNTSYEKMESHLRQLSLSTDVELVTVCNTITATYVTYSPNITSTAANFLTVTA